MSKSSQIKDLEGQIIKHKSLYYRGKPEISDFEYDALEDKLREIDPTNPVLEIVGSDQLVGEKVAHESKMLSLNKTYKIDELEKWMDGKDVLSTFKIDGSSCSIIYKRGQYHLAKTRGDGSYGENISNKILFIDHVPKRIPNQIDFEVRGEVYCHEKDFIHLSEQMESMGLEKPTSQRNIVAGLLGRKENIDLCKYLSFQAFEFITDDLDIKTEKDKLLTLKEFGFETPEFFINKNKRDLQDRISEASDFMSNGDYLIDGMVFSFNDVSIHEELGATAHHPRFKMAFKFQGETKTTRLKSISWQVSRNGFLTPVGNVEPVELSGAKVSRVTLHNFGMVRQFNLKQGDEIEIVRSGEVIPKFLGVVKESKNKFKYPTICPSCGQGIVIEDIRLVCKNEFCPDKVKDEILNFIQKIGIDDLSSKRLEELIKAGLVKDIPSLYELSETSLMTMDKVKEKLAGKIISNIEKTKKVDLVTFLASLGISGGAYNKCEKIVDNGFDSIDKILNMTALQLSEVESFAEKSANDFVNSIQSKRKLIEELLSKGIEIKKKVINSDSDIAGLKFCITGSLSMKRSDLQKIIKSNGGIAVSSVSKNTDYLITNDTQSNSSKFKKAQELEIPIINEQAFLNMVGD
jgi:DNA ligase (NAD+)